MEEVFNKYCSEVIPYCFNDEKNETKELFKPIINEILSNNKIQEKPIFIHMLGIPGAGKTTYMNNNKENFKDFLFLDFDMVMEKLPEYRKDVKMLGLVESFEKWQIPARVAGYEVLLQAIKKRLNIFFDHGGSPFLHVKLLEEVKTLGYKVKIVYVKCDIDMAIKRVKEREKITLRHTPEKLIIDREPLIKERAEQFKKIADEFIEVNNG
ncbi:MAG: zeta toxin family protein [Rickettsiales bacterium]|nr:zeta toxin family protein [Rickettsiales bacterium]